MRIGWSGVQGEGISRLRDHKGDCKANSQRGAEKSSAARNKGGGSFLEGPGWHEVRLDYEISIVRASQAAFSCGHFSPSTSKNFSDGSDPLAIHNLVRGVR